MARKRGRRISTIHARYVFLDVAGFTLNRSVEAQASIVGTLNRIVRQTLRELGIKNRILLPTGDGMCIAIDAPSDIDVHIRTALKILEHLNKYNADQSEQSH